MMTITPDLPSMRSMSRGFDSQIKCKVVIFLPDDG